MTYLSTKNAAGFLNLQIAETVTYWTNFLINNRNKSRNPPYRIPYDKVHGDIIYSDSDLLHFIEWEHFRRQGALKINRYTQLEKISFDRHESSQRYSKALSCFFEVKKDIETNKPFISFNIHRPIPAYKLTIDEAEHLKALLSEAIHQLKQS